jgi:hypothetical protein
MALPSIAWLAKGNPKWWRRRRSEPLLTPEADGLCRCGHRFDNHRWSERRRRVRVRWREWRRVELAHECNLAGCDCRYFLIDDGARLPRQLLRRINALPQAPYLSTELNPKPDKNADNHAYPPGAQPLKRRGEPLAHQFTEEDYQDPLIMVEDRAYEVD